MTIWGAVTSRLQVAWCEIACRYVREMFHKIVQMLADVCSCWVAQNCFLWLAAQKHGGYPGTVCSFNEDL
jgi:hypothetical protein